jgi:hypothetical protein
MAFVRGHKKLGGRKKGEGKVQLLKAVRQIWADRQYNPIEEATKIAQASKAKPLERFRMHMQLAPYGYAVEKPLEQAGQGSTFQLVLLDRRTDPQTEIPQIPAAQTVEIALDAN